MKKLLSVVVAALAACLLFVLVGCGPADVNGKTYTYDRIEAVGEGKTDAELKAAEAAAALLFGDEMTGLTLSFKDGKVTMKNGANSSETEYTQDGNTITAGTQKLYVDGSKIYMETAGAGVGFEGITFRVYYKA